MNGPFYLVNIETKKVSKKSWKTYKGALKNAKSNDVVMTQEGIKWLERYPEWAQKRINNEII